MRETVEYRLHVKLLCAVPPFRDFRVAHSASTERAFPGVTRDEGGLP